MVLTVFGLLTLQVGVIVLATSFITTGLCILMTNLLGLDPDLPLPWVIVLLSSMFLLIIWGFACVGAINESFKVLRAVHIMWSVFIVIWIVLTFWSGFSDGIRNVCISSRCPESLWLVENPRPYLRTYEFEDNNNSPSPQINPSSELKKVESVLNAETYLSDALNKQINKTDIDGNNGINGEYEYEYHYNNITDSLSRFSENTKHRSIQASIITSVLVVLIFLGYFIYAWIVLRSYQTCVRLRSDGVGNGTNPFATAC